MIKIEQIKIDDNAIFLDGDKICSFKNDGRFFTAAKVIDEIEVNIYTD